MSRKAGNLGNAAVRDRLWTSVVARDRGTDGQFYYGVVTTGVYCRPSCSSRTPRPENVRFFQTAEEAEQAGFRPCKRCRPGQPSLAQRQAELVAGVCRQIASAATPPSLAALAQSARMSTYHLHRVFKSVTGVTPRAYAAAQRGSRIREALACGRTVTEAIYGAGYSSSGRFYQESGWLLGMTPKKFRAGGAGTAIRFAVGQCSLGAILVAASERGVCAILMGDDPEALVRDLQDRFPKAHLIGGDSGFEQWVAKVVGFVEMPKVGLDLPLDLRGTAFQLRVWQALREIPAGSTASYSQIAVRIGRPASARAVARACAANMLAVAIPCHRVVRSDGKLSGYRWGIERMRALLKREEDG